MRSIAVVLIPCLLFCLCLTGCTSPDQPATTSDKVLAVQYRASTLRGVMTGAEASKISEAYTNAIAAPPAQQAAQASATQRGMPQ